MICDELCEWCDLDGDYSCDDCTPDGFIYGVTFEETCHHCGSENVVFHCVACECELCEEIEK